MEQKKTTGHSLTLCDREKLTLTGVTDVDAFNEEEITEMLFADVMNGISSRYDKLNS